MRHTDNLKNEVGFINLDHTMVQKTTLAIELTITSQ